MVVAYSYMSQPIRTRAVVATCPACGVTGKLLARVDWDGERWRHRRSCWDTHCKASWSPLDAGA